MYPSKSDVEHYYYNPCNFGPDIIAHMGNMHQHDLQNLDADNISPHSPMKRLKHVGGGGMNSMSSTGEDDPDSGSVVHDGYYVKSPNNQLPSVTWQSHVEHGTAFNLINQFCYTNPTNLLSFVS